MKISESNFGVLPPPQKKKLEPKNVDFNFVILCLHCKYLEIVTSYHQSENSVAISLAPWPNLVYFVVHKRRNRTVVLTHPQLIVDAIG